MSGTSLKIMVDANVWVDSFCVDHAESLAARIGQKTREISDLRLKLKLRKLGGDYSHLTGDKK